MSKLYKRKEQKIEAIQYNGRNLREIKRLIPDIKEWQEFWKGRNLQCKPNKSDYFLIDQETSHVELISEDGFNHKYEQINNIDFQRLFDQDTDYGNSQRPDIPSTGVIMKDGFPSAGNLSFLIYPVIIAPIILMILNYYFYEIDNSIPNNQIIYKYYGKERIVNPNNKESE